MSEQKESSVLFSLKELMNLEEDRIKTEEADKAAQVENVEIFHAGTRADGGRILANGGRVLNVSARGRTVREAQSRAYAAVDRIKWPEGFCRRDIGWRAVQREK